MKIKELIKLLETFDPNAEVGVHSNSMDYDVDFIDGAAHVYTNVVILTTADPEEED